MSEQENARVKWIDRNQNVLRAVHVDKLVAATHAVRGIWELVGQLDLARFYQPIRAVQGVAGRTAWDPRLLISVWIYAYSRGIGSAREISRRCQHDPAFQWLTGLEEINHHTLSDFRIQHERGLQELFVQILGVLSKGGLIQLKRVMHDGTKIRANAAGDSFRREGRLAEHLQKAREQIEQVDEQEQQQASRRQASARRRGQRQRAKRLERAIEEVQKLQREGDKRKESRVSWTDPEARIMKLSEGGFAPSYNVQISTDAQAKIIVGVGVSQSAADQRLLPEAVARVQDNLQAPEQVVADGGFSCAASIAALQQQGIDLIMKLPDAAEQIKRHGIDPAFGPEAFQYDSQTDSFVCPAGKKLLYRNKEQRPGGTRYRYRANPEDCRQCPLKSQCCPKTNRGRWVARREDDPAVAALRQKMQSPQAQEIYRQRGPIAEFPNLWIKSKIGLRRFSVRGIKKVTMEAIWACLTYNIQQWLRLCWQPQGFLACDG